MAPPVAVRLAPLIVAAPAAENTVPAPAAATVAPGLIATTPLPGEFPAATLSEPPLTSSTLPSVRLPIVELPPVYLTVRLPDTLIVTSSAEMGTAPPDQFFASCQVELSPSPVQLTWASR